MFRKIRRFVACHLDVVFLFGGLCWVCALVSCVRGAIVRPCCACLLAEGTLLVFRHRGVSSALQGLHRRKVRCNVKRGCTRLNFLFWAGTLWGVTVGNFCLWHLFPASLVRLWVGGPRDPRLLRHQVSLHVTLVDRPAERWAVCRGGLGNPVCLGGEANISAHPPSSHFPLFTT